MADNPYTASSAGAEPRPQNHGAGGQRLFQWFAFFLGCLLLITVGLVFSASGLDPLRLCYLLPGIVPAFLFGFGMLFRHSQAHAFWLLSIFWFASVIAAMALPIIFLIATGSD